MPVRFGPLQITAVAGERQVPEIVRAPVLLRDDVLHVMPQFAMFLWQAAVLALLAGPAAYEASGFFIHVLLNFCIQVQTGLELQDGNEIGCVNERLIFRALALAERAFVGARGKNVNALLHGRIDPKIHNAACGVRIEAAAQWFQQTVQATHSAHVTTLARKTMRPWSRAKEVRGRGAHNHGFSVGTPVPARCGVFLVTSIRS